ncbi:hypothetical protein PINS_up005678 [Pythium insidiosum]|nr:hypothetical protein PINS_up005678 [Pythium insidiosum]
MPRRPRRDSYALSATAARSRSSSASFADSCGGCSPSPTARTTTRAERSRSSGKLAFARGGFVSDALREAIWPLLLGTDTQLVVHREHEQHFTRLNAEHRDDGQVEKDIERSLWHYDVVLNIREGERRVKRKQLTTIINAVLNDNEALYYFQGYHDTCSVFLLVLGDQRAFHAMRTLSATYHREPMRTNFDTVLHTIRLLLPLLETEDDELFLHLRESGVRAFRHGAARITMTD